jgi:hypothetical protein
VSTHKHEEAGPVGGILPGHVDPTINLGDLINYSGLLGKLVSTFASLKGTPIGESVNLPDIETYLPSLGEWGLEIKATHRR